jgi:hypothetical protein
MGKGVLQTFHSHADQTIERYAVDGYELTDWVCYISDTLGEPWPLGEKLMCALDITDKEFPYIQRNVKHYLAGNYPNGKYPEIFNRIIRPCSVCGKETICFFNGDDLFCSEKCENQAESDKISRMIDDYAPAMSEKRRQWVTNLLFRNAQTENWTDEQYIEFIREYEHK